MDVARRRQRQVEGAEEQVGAGQTQDEGRGGVRAQFAAPHQSGDSQRITYAQHTQIVSNIIVHIRTGYCQFPSSNREKERKPAGLLFFFLPSIFCT